MDRRARRLSLALVTAVAAGTAACGGSPSPPPGQVRVAGMVGEDEPLFAVDWPSTMRAELETSMQSGLGVVSLRPGERLKVLPGCTARASYRSVTLSPKHDVVELATHEQISAALPFSALGLTGKVGAGHETDEVVEVAILARRQSIAPALAFSTSELRGDCTGATHVVTSVVRGAFTVSRRGKSETSASADVAAFGANARSTQRSLVAKSDGDPAVCRSAGAPAEGCDALVKVTLRPVTGASALTRPGDAWGKISCVDCAAECDRGDLAACVTIGHREVEAQNEARAERLFRAACDGQVGHGCTGLGMLYDPEGKDRPGSYADPAKALALYARGCDLGSLDGCKFLSFHVHDEARFRLADEGLARRVAKACQAGDELSCGAVANWYLQKGKHLARTGTPGVAEAFDQAITWERRRCSVGTPPELAKRPCLLENWTKVRAGLSGR